MFHYLEQQSVFFIPKQKNRQGDATNSSYLGDLLTMYEHGMYRMCSNRFLFFFLRIFSNTNLHLYLKS